MNAIASFMEGGGSFMWPIAALLVVGSIIILERFYAIMFKFNGNSSKLMQKVQRCILDNNINQALNLCNSRRHSAVHQVFKAALVNADRPFDEIQDHVEVASLAVVPKLQNRISFIFTIANVATLLGLLGTIYGLILTFESIGAVDASAKQELLSTGISKAMSTTAFGLIVAIPCMLAYGYLFNRINSMVDEIEHYSARLLMLLRTGSEYFDSFSDEAMITTKQEMKKKDVHDDDMEDEPVDQKKAS